MKKLIFIFLLIGTSRLWGGDCPKPSSCEAFEYAKYAEKVYRDNSEGEPFDLGCPKSGFCLPSVQQMGDGLYAEVFKRDDGYVIAFRGTKEDQDISDDVDQGLNGHNKQFAEAMEYFKLVNDALDKCGNAGPRTIVGHSLGGALAQYVAGVADEKYTTVTFNPAALLPADSPAPKACVFNYVNGNDILKRVVNPLVAEIGRADRDDNWCALNGPSRSSGTDTPVGVEVPPYDFTGDLTKADVTELRRAAEEVPEMKKFMASGNLNIILNSDKLYQIITRLSRIRGLEKVFARIDPSLGSDWKNLCAEANAPISFRPSFLIRANNFKSALDKVLGTAVDAHGLGKVENEASIKEWDRNYGLLHPVNPLFPDPPRPVEKYTLNSMLDLLQKQCNSDTLGGSGGKNGNGSSGTTSGNGPGTGGTTPTDPNAPLGNNTVSGGCFGDVPLVNGRVPTFLDGMGQIIDGIDDAKDQIEDLQEKIEEAREIEAIVKKLKAQFDAFDKFTAGVGKYTPVIDKIFKGVDILSKICNVSTLLADGYTALATGDKDAFAEMINARVREAVVDVSKEIGSALGKFLGTAGGTAVGGGIASPLTGLLGGWLGGAAGEWLGEKVGGWAYDTFIAKWIKENISDVLFDMMCPGYGGGSGGSGPGIDPGTDPGGPILPYQPPLGTIPGTKTPSPDDPGGDVVKILPSSGKILKSSPTQPYTREEQLKRYSK